jgi:site-specific DNA-adenine methylase
MNYPGGKNGAGVYQQLINLMPPHHTYIEPFLGSGAILRLKRPAQASIGIDADADGVDRYRELLSSPTLTMRAAFRAARNVCFYLVAPQLLVYTRP